MYISLAILFLFSTSILSGHSVVVMTVENYCLRHFLNILTTMPHPFLNCLLLPGFPAEKLVIKIKT